MTFLFIYYGDKISDLRMKCINSVLDKTTDNDKIVFITNLKSINSNKNIEYIDFNKYLKKISKKYDYVDKILKEELKIVYKTDIIRFVYLSENENVFYNDTDIHLKNLPSFDNNLYFSTFKNNNKFLDCSSIYSGKNNRDTLLNILKLAIRRCYITKNFIISMPWIFNVLIENKESKIIDNFYIDHLNLKGID